MRTGSRVGLVFLFLGVLLLVGALGLYQSNRREALEAETSAREVMTIMADIIGRERAQPVPMNTPHPSSELSEEELSPAEPAMNTVEIEGYRYIGFLTIRALELELPVMEEWDYDRLRIAPCRFSGTLAGGDLVIAAHNYLYHFGRLKDLPVGSEILFTDAWGESTRFLVEELEILQPGDVESMTAGEYDLTLFTCTYGGATRFTVRCMRG